jgi:hypothetical protein
MIRFSVYIQNVDLSFLAPSREEFRLDVRLICLYHTCFSPSLQEGIMLDVRLVSLCYNMSAHLTAAARLPGE